jgi:hypothetical protein
VCRNSPLLVLALTNFRAKESNTLIDRRFWTLLAEIVSVTEVSASARSTKMWLVPLLTRIPIAPTIVSFLVLLPSLDEKRRRELTDIVCRCLVIIWPFAVPKFGYDALFDCFSAILRSFRLCEADEKLAQMGCLITSSFRTSLANVSNRKKVQF